MYPIHTAQEIRDAEAGVFAERPDAPLMQQAADAVAEQAWRMVQQRVDDQGGHRPADQPRRVLVVAGAGNNGGDALFAAARLAERGCEVSLWPALAECHAQGLAAARAAGCRELDLPGATDLASQCDLAIDGLFGIGGRPGLPASVAILADELLTADVPVLAVDIPSGLDADSGALHPSFQASTTITFGARKRCHVLQPAASRCGTVVLADIGLDLGRADMLQLEKADLAVRWPVPGPTDDKYSRGVVGIDTGSLQYPGAAVLGTMGAVYSGAGMVRFVGADMAAGKLGYLLPSVTFGEGKVQAWLLGSGWGNVDSNRERLATRLASRVPMVVDADGLQALPDRFEAPTLLTPHPGELARMLGVERNDVTGQPIEHAREAAERWNATVLLKGATQYVVEAEGPVLLAVPGPHWTAQAGSGDVLAGVCATLLAAGLHPRWAGALGASLQAVTAQVLDGPYPPDVVARGFGAMVGELARSRRNPDRG